MLVARAPIRPRLGIVLRPRRSRFTHSLALLGPHLHRKVHARVLAREIERVAPSARARPRRRRSSRGRSRARVSLPSRARSASPPRSIVASAAADASLCTPPSRPCRDAGRRRRARRCPATFGASRAIRKSTDDAHARVDVARNARAETRASTVTSRERPSRARRRARGIRTRNRTMTMTTVRHR